MLDINLSTLNKISTEKLAKVKTIKSNDIAIIGLSGYFPKSEDIQGFWENLINGVDCVDSLPENRRSDMDRYLSNYLPGLYENGYDKGSYLAEIDKFDYGFFKISPNEAALMDPSQRLFLQTAYHAVEDAGYGGERLGGSNTGVYLGYNADALFAYRNLIADINPEMLAIAVPGNLTSVISGRISYLLDLKGPSISVDTACSSSLVAVHLACQALRSGDCTMALAGSVRLNILPINRMQKLGIESSDGITRTFDEKSDGTGNGEGMAVIMLKPLSDALNDKDNIYAVIKGSAVNQDGSSIGITAPNVKAQEEVILSAWRNAGIEPETISYIEAHGTGTKLGDPIEIDAITKAFSKHTNKKQFCAIGSVKTNMGHLDNAAGIAGIVKAALSIKQGVIPPHIHFETPNTKIDFQNSPVYVNTKLTDWKTGDNPRRCGVSAFGLSGTNCHIIMEEAPSEEISEQSMKACIVSLSAKSLTALESLVENYQSFSPSSGCTLEKLAYTANIGRGHYKYRLAIIARDIDDFKCRVAQIKPPYQNLNIPDVFFGQIGGEIHKGKDTQAVSGSDLTGIARYYAEGGTVNWNDFYKGNNPGKTRIPVYPFEKNRCWIELPELANTMPLAEELVAVTVLEKKQNVVFPLGREDGGYTCLETSLVQIYGEVLGFEEINIYDDFYDLGGDSIIAMKIVNIIEDRLGIETDMSDLLECIGVADYSEVLEQKMPAVVEMTQSNDLSNQQAIMPTLSQKLCCEASAVQKRLFMISQNQDLSMSYNITNAIQINGKIDSRKIELVFKSIIKRHESLRTSFEMIHGEIMQIIHSDADFHIDYYESDESGIENIMNSFVRAFDLSKPPLMRVGLIKCSAEKHIFIFDCSHIIADGFSVNIINDEFVRLYLGQNLEPITYQYRDYTLHQSQIKQSDLYAMHKRYWMDKLSGELPVLSVATDYPRPTQIDMTGAMHRFKISQDTLQSLNTVSSKNGATLFMVLLAAYNILLSKYCGQEDIIVGTPIAGRNKGNFDKVVGMFVNTLALRNYPERDKTFDEFLQQVKQTTLEAYKHEAFQFDDLVIALDIKRDRTRNPVFDTMFALQNLGFNELKVDDISFKQYEMDTKTSRFDLMFNAIPVSDGIEVNIEYSSVLFRKETICGMGEHFLNILEVVADNQELKLSDITMLSVEEMRRYTSDTWRKATSYPLEKTLIQLFLEQVKRLPNDIAVVSEDKSLTYTQLDMQSDAIAYEIASYGLNKGDIVAIILERGTDTIAAILATLKAGCAYLPIDISYPQERISYMLEDSGAKLVITHDSLRQMYLEYNVNVITVHPKQNDEEQRLYYTPADIASSDPAYVIYTSGSTGNPKGVVVEHRSVINFIYNLNDRYGGEVNETDRFLAITNLCFDVSVCELFMSLCFGAQLHFYHIGGALDIEKLSEYIVCEGITYTYLPPALLEDMSQALKRTPKSVQLNKMLVGVEPIKDFVLEQYLKLNPKMIIVNGYGPTEATVCATFYTYSPNTESNRIVPIGSPLNNTEIYLLDKSLQPVPVGVHGEICISGMGLAREYLNRQKLTEEKFIDNPFLQGERLYRTGDIGKLLPDGNIHFTGRIDDQVKIRGYRVEPGEIESKIKELMGVRQAVVLDKQDKQGTKCLCAYIVCDQEINASQLRSQLKSKLPDYMIPSYFVKIQTIPLTPNGKTDRKALPEVNGDIKTGTEYVPPKNDTQRRLVAIWQTLLDADKVGIEDNFFDLGGHSLKAAKLVSEIQNAFGIEMNLNQVFGNPTVKEQEAYIYSAYKCDYKPISKAAVTTYYPLSAAQERLYILNRMDGGVTYNIPCVLKIKGKLDVNRFEDTLNRLVERHGQLRASFHMVDEKPVQKIHEHVSLAFEQLTCSEDKVDTYVKAFIRPFDFEKASLIRFLLLKTSDDCHYFAYDMHHIISDGVSSVLLASEFMALYAGKMLVEPAIEYQDYVLWQKENIQEAMEQETFWMKQLSGNLPVLDMPTDFKRPPMRDYLGAKKSFSLDLELVKKIRQTSAENGITPYMLCMAAYSILLYKYTSQEDILVGTPVAGRSRLEFEDVAGMFVNTIVLRHYPCGFKKVLDFLSEVKDNTIAAFDHQAYQFETLVQKLDIKRDSSRNPLFDTLFVYQNMGIKERHIEGVTFENYPLEGSVSKFDLTFEIVENQETMYLNIEYATSLYVQSTIERMAKHYITLLEAIIADSEKTIEAYSLITEEEEKLILETFNDTQVEYSKDKTLDSLFEEQVEKIPNRIAAGFGDKTLTYSELNGRANSLAYRLRDAGVKADSIVGIMAERSLEMMIGILAVLKAGGAYMSIGPTYPQDRISYMLEETQAKVLLAQEQFIGKVAHDKVINLDDEQIYKGETKNLEKESKAHSLAYVMFTSGSTGKPKGVMIEHTSAVNQMEWRQKQYPLGKEDKIMQKTPFTFDISVAELFWWMLGGASIYFLEPGGEKDSLTILETIEKQKITIIHFVPSMLSIFLEYYEMHQDEYDLSSIKRIVSGGEALTVPQAEKCNKLMYKNNQITLHNLYGPTEATIEVSYYDCPTTEKIDNILIGKPSNNARLYVLDKQQRLQPVGVVGELYISGVGVARGYLNREDLTTEKFMKDPYYDGYRMYRSGDLAKWLENGEVEYLGRMDNQVKIRGLRIELGEIEDRMSEHELLNESAVTVREDEEGNKYLCGYYTGIKELSIDVLRKHITEKLPDYMVPSYFMKLDKMPLSANGKLDRKALPEIEGYINTGMAYAPPQNDIEYMLTSIWGNVLKLDKISVLDHFANLGGDSIKAIQVVSKLTDKGYTVNVRDIIGTNHIRELSEKIKITEKTYNQMPIQGFIDMIPVQICFFEFNYINMHIWNIPTMFYMKEGFDEQIVRTVFQAVITHHDALRMVFKQEDGIRKQYNRGLEGKLFDLSVYDMTSCEDPTCEIEKTADAIQASISLEKGPLVKLGLFKTNGCDYMLFVIHHLVADFTSLQVIQEDIMTAYHQILENQPIKLPKKTASFKEWSDSIYRFARSKDIVEELNYWMAIDKADIAPLPKDHYNVNRQVRKETQMSIELPREETKAFIDYGMKKYGASPNELLLNTLAQAFKEWCGNTAIRVRLAGNGKDWCYDELNISRTVGWFSVSYPVVIDTSSASDEENLKNTMSMLRALPKNGCGYDVLRYITLPERIEGPQLSCETEMFFNYIGIIDAETPTDVGDFGISNMPLGRVRGDESDSVYNFDFSVAIMYGKLTVTVTYLKTEYDDQTVKNLLNAFANRVRLAANNR